MATYKVIQDIESEDKLLGPFTLHQFIYAAIVIVMGFIAFKLATVNPLMVLPFLLPMCFFGLLAAPFGHDQSSEVWLLAKVRFFLKPRKRIWNQSGIQDLVTITVPKKVESHLTDGLSQTEVRSRLKALANTIDSRGWAVKNINVNQPVYSPGQAVVSDRLVDAGSLPQEVPMYDVLAADDIMDETSNPTAQHLDTMINQSEQAHRQALIATVQNNATAPAAPQPADYWFMNQPAVPPILEPGYAAFAASPTITPGTAPTDKKQISDTGEAEQQLLEQIHHDEAMPNPAYGNMRVLNPTSEQPAAAPTQPPAAINPTQTNGKDTIARLSKNDDLNISTIAREANKTPKQPPDDEVVVSLR